MDQIWLAWVIVGCGGVLPLCFRRRFGWMKAAGASGIALGGFIGCAGAIAGLRAGGIHTASLSYLNRLTLSVKLDPLSAFFLMLISGVSALAAIYSFHYMASPQKALRTALHYLFFSILVISMSLVVMADTLLTFILFWEVMSLSSFFLVVFDYEAGENRKAGYYYLVFSQAGALFIAAAFAVIYAHTGSLELTAEGLPPAAKAAVFLLAFVGLGSKAGVFPFHIWLPYAHPAAPSHISAVMSGVMIKIGIYGMLRLYQILAPPGPAFGVIVLIFGMISGVLGVVYALAQHDLKRLLAYHSVENIGIILIGVGVGMIGMSAGDPVVATLGFTGGLLHVLNHAVFKSLLFMGAGVVAHAAGTRTIDRLGGLIRPMKITGITFLIGSLAISGLPPFNGFVSEFFIYMGGFRGLIPGKNTLALYLLGIVSLSVIGGLALACFTKVVGVVFLGEPRSPEARTVTEKGALMLIPMMILAGFCIGIGVFPGGAVSLTLRSVSVLMGSVPPSPVLNLTVAITRSALAFLILLMGVRGLRFLLYRGKTVTFAGTWGCGFTRPTARMQYTGTSYAGAILEFFRPAAPLEEQHPPVAGLFPASTRYHSRVHDLTEKYMVRGIMTVIPGVFDKLRWLQHGDIHLYIGYILLTIVVLLFFV